jgi:hypothetical protein
MSPPSPNQRLPFCRHTPPRSEERRNDAFLERISSEFGTRLAALGPAATTSRLTAHLSSLVGTPALLTLMPAPQAAHLLTVAYRGMCGAELVPARREGSGSPTAAQQAKQVVDPVSPMLIHLRLSLPGSIDYPWLQAIVSRVRAGPHTPTCTCMNLQ